MKFQYVVFRENNWEMSYRFNKVPSFVKASDIVDDFLSKPNDEKEIGRFDAEEEARAVFESEKANCSTSKSGSCLYADVIELAKVEVDDEDPEDPEDIGWNIVDIFAKSWLAPSRDYGCGVSFDNGRNAMTAEDAMPFIEATGNLQNVVDSMDDDLRECLHEKLSHCSNLDFLKEYLSHSDEDLCVISYKMPDFRIKPEYYDLWAEYDGDITQPISFEDIETLAWEWDKPLAELLSQVEPIEK